MLGAIASRLFGSANQRQLKKLGKTVERINALEPKLQALDDAALTARTDEFRQRLAGGETLDALLPEVCLQPHSHAVLSSSATKPMGEMLLPLCEPSQ